MVSQAIQETIRLPFLGRIQSKQNPIRIGILTRMLILFLITLRRTTQIQSIRITLKTLLILTLI